MKTKIFKYIISPKDIDRNDIARISMVPCAKILSVAAQRGEIAIWAQVNTELTKVDPCYRRIAVKGTGHDFDTEVIPKVEPVFIGTVMLYDGDLVFHLFDCGEGK